MGEGLPAGATRAGCRAALQNRLLELQNALVDFEALGSRGWGGFCVCVCVCVCAYMKNDMTKEHRAR